MREPPLVGSRPGAARACPAVQLYTCSTQAVGMRPLEFHDFPRTFKSSPICGLTAYGMGNSLDRGFKPNVRVTHPTITHRAPRVRRDDSAKVMTFAHRLIPEETQS